MPGGAVMTRTLCRYCRRPSAVYGDRVGVTPGLCWSDLVMAREASDPCILEAARLRYAEKGAPEIAMTALSSTAIAAYGYDAERQTLRLQLRGGKRKDGSYGPGQTRDYLGVPGFTARRFLSAPSAGKAYAEYIRGLPSVRLDEAANDGDLEELLRASVAQAGA